jgi:hypothetical protein
MGENTLFRRVWVGLKNSSVPLFAPFLGNFHTQARVYKGRTARSFVRLDIIALTFCINKLLKETDS